MLPPLTLFWVVRGGRSLAAGVNSLWRHLVSRKRLRFFVCARFSSWEHRLMATSFAFLGFPLRGSQSLLNESPEQKWQLPTRLKHLFPHSGSGRLLVRAWRAQGVGGSNPLSRPMNTQVLIPSGVD